MGNNIGGSSAPTTEIQPSPFLVKRNESFGSKSPRQTPKHIVKPNKLMSPQESEYFEGVKSPRGREGERMNGSTPMALRHCQMIRHNRSHSLEQSGLHSPSSSRSSSSNSYINSVLTGTSSAAAGGASVQLMADRSCLRKSTELPFQISGDLNPHQIGVVKRCWKLALKAVGNDETEIAVHMLLRISQLDPRNLTYFSLNGIPANELRHNPVFIEHVNAFEPTLVHVMNHLTNATTLSKHLQQLGGRHVNHTGVTYKCAYWKSFTQAMIDVLTGLGGGNNNAELQEALGMLGDFCVEQMRIGYRIEHKLQSEAERLTQAQQRRRRAFDLANAQNNSPF